MQFNCFACFVLFGAHLFFGQVVGEVGDHDLGLGRNAIGRGATLATLALGPSLVLGLHVRVSLVLDVIGNVLQWLNLRVALGIGRDSCGLGGSSSDMFAVLLVLASIL